MNTMLCHFALCGSILLADHLPAQDAAAKVERATIGNVAVENWLHGLVGRWKWTDGSQSGDLELRLVAGGLAVAGRGSGFAAGGESHWVILWDAANRQLVTTVISSSGEYHHAAQDVSGKELRGKFTGTSESADGLRFVRGECIWKLPSRGAFSISWKPWFIADQGQIDRRFEFQRSE